MYIDQYIKKILSYYPCIVMSWGLESCVPIMECEEGEGGLSIRVNGFKHTGEVRIMLNWLDLFDVYLLNQDGTIKEKISDIYVDSLVSVLDHAIEKVDNYEERVKREYSIQ